jgi:hypothetical protein
VQGISIERVDVVELDKLCKRVADDVRRLFEMFDAEKSIHVEPDGVVVVKSVPVLIGPEGKGVMLKLDSYDWASVNPNGLLLDALICSLHVSNDVQLYKPFKRLLIVGGSVVWEGAERPYTAKEFVQAVTKNLTDLMLKAAERLRAQP